MPGTNGNRRSDGTFAPKGTGNLTGNKLANLHSHSDALKQAHVGLDKHGMSNKPKPGDTLVSPSGQTRTVSHIHKASGSVIFEGGSSMTEQMWAIHGHKWQVKQSAASKSPTAAAQTASQKPLASDATGKANTTGLAPSKSAHKDNPANVDNGGFKPTVVHSAQNKDGATVKSGQTVEWNAGVGHGKVDMKQGVVQHFEDSGAGAVAKIQHGVGQVASVHSNNIKPVGSTQAAGTFDPVAHQKQLRSLQSLKSIAKKSGDEAKIKAVDQKIADHKAKSDANKAAGTKQAEKPAEIPPKQETTTGAVKPAAAAAHSPEAALKAAKPLKPQNSDYWPFKGNQPHKVAEGEAISTAKSLKNFGEDVPGIHDVKVGDVFFNAHSGDVFAVRGSDKAGGVTGDVWNSKGKLVGRTEGNHTTGVAGEAFDHNFVRLYGASNSKYSYPKKEVAPGVFTGDMFRDDHSGKLFQVDGKVVGVKDRLAVNPPGTISSGTSMSAGKVKELLDKQKNSEVNKRAY